MKKAGIIGGFVLILLVLFYFPAFTQIKSDTTMKDVQAEIDRLTKATPPSDILIAFDIDMTLIQPDHPAVFYPSLRQHIDIYKHLMGTLTPEQKDFTVTLFTQVLPQRLVEEDTPSLIKAFQDKGIKVIALTSSLSGKAGNYKEKLIELRARQLKEFGFDFSSASAFAPQHIEFTDFKPYNNGFPTFYHGILSTNGEGNAPKGEILVSFLKHLKGPQPKVVILVDDKKAHLEIAEAALKAYDPSIQFVGIHYKGAYDYAPRVPSKDEFRKFWEDMAERAKASVR